MQPTNSTHRFVHQGASPSTTRWQFILGIGLWLTLLSQHGVLAQTPPTASEAKEGREAKEAKADSATANRINVLSPQLEPTHSIELSTEVAGMLASVQVSEGETVKSGQLLAQLRDETLRLRVSKAKVERDVAAAKAASDIDLRLASKSEAVASTEWRRAVEANRSVRDAIPPNEVDRLKLVLDRTTLEVERAKTEAALRKLSLASAENDLQQAELMLAQHRVLSPVAAMVVAVDKHGGEWVEPGTRIVRLMAIDKLRIQGAVPVALASAELRDCPAMLTIRRGDQDLQVAGKVSFVSPEANPINGHVRVYIQVDNSRGQLRPGMKVLTATIQSGEGAP